MSSPVTKEYSRRGFSGKEWFVVPVNCWLPLKIGQSSCPASGPEEKTSRNTGTKKYERFILPEYRAHNIFPGANNIKDKYFISLQSYALSGVFIDPQKYLSPGTRNCFMSHLCTKSIILTYLATILFFSVIFLTHNTT
jgi:hypothetical protein